MHVVVLVFLIIDQDLIYYSAFKAYLCSHFDVAVDLLVELDNALWLPDFQLSKCMMDLVGTHHLEIPSIGTFLKFKP